MNEEEQGQEAFRCHRRPPRGPGAQMLDDQELEELLGIARLRLRAGKALADVGLTYQELLRRVLQARMVARQMEPVGEGRRSYRPKSATSWIGDSRRVPGPAGPGLWQAGQLPGLLAPAGQVDAPRHRPPRRATAPPPSPAGHAHVIPLWQAAEQHKATKADALAPVVDRLVRSRKRTISVDDPEIDELVQVAHLRRYVGQALAAAGTPYKRRLWSVLRLRLAAALRRQATRRRGPTHRRGGGSASWSGGQPPPPSPSPCSPWAPGRPPASPRSSHQPGLRLRGATCGRPGRGRAAADPGAHDGSRGRRVAQKRPRSGSAFPLGSLPICPRASNWLARAYYPQSANQPGAGHVPSRSTPSVASIPRTVS